MFLSVADYDASEREARSRMGYAQISAFADTTFSAHGFPSRMSEERELFRYADFVVDGSLDRLQQGTFFADTSSQTDCTFDEVVLLRKIALAAANITERASGRAHHVIFSHLSSIGQFRIVQAIANHFGGKPLSVFEVGPGCGYAGALLGLAGHTHVSYDIAQGLYLWQNRLFSFLFGEEFAEYAGNPAADCLDGISARIAHLPWWDIARFYQRCPIAADIVLSNANLGEIHPLCLRYLFKLWPMMLERSRVGLVVFSSVGAEHHANRHDINTMFRDAGFVPVLHNNVHAYGLAGRSYPRDMISALEEKIPLHDPSKFGKTFAPREFITLGENTASEELKFYAFASGWSLK